MYKIIAAIIIVAIGYFAVTADRADPTPDKPQCTHRLGKAQVVYRNCIH